MTVRFGSLRCGNGPPGRSVPTNTLLHRLGNVGADQRALQSCFRQADISVGSLLIADEPTGNLDPETAKEIMALLDDINKAGTTILMATHAKDIVDMMKKRVLAVEKGVIVRDEKRGKYEYEV